MTNFRNLLCLILISLFIVACGDSDSGGSQLVDVSNAEHFIVSTDHEGYINIHALNHDGSIISVMAFQFTPNFTGAVPVTLGEIKHHHSSGTTMVIVQSGADENNNGGILAFKAESVAKDQSTAGVRLIPLVSTLTTDGNTLRETRIVHTYLDPDDNHLWANNDGPRGALAGEPDSSFKIDIASLFTATPEIKEVLVGNGHKKSAFMHPTTANPTLPKLFVTHNGRDGTYSVINNDEGTDPVVVQTVPSTPPTAETRESFHGMASSTINGHVYVGSTKNTPTANVAVSILDTTTVDASNNYVVKSIPNGEGPGQIPAAGYMLESHDGNRVYTFGWRIDPADTTETNANGYVSIIDSSVADDTVVDVVKLSNIGAASIDIATLTDNSTTPPTVTKKLYIPSRITNCFGGTQPAHAAATLNEIVVLNLDENGDAIRDANNNNAPSIERITVGDAPCHRNGEVSSDNKYVVYPNGCRETAGCEVDTINVIHTEDNHVDTFTTQGKNPGIAIFISAEDVLGSGSGGHSHAN